MSYKNILIAVFWFALLAAFAVYYPGLRGGFLFDDAPNLSPMGALGEVKDWETFRAFVFNGIAGPLGRPISLMSFLLDDNYWPTQPESFKLTNVWLHLLIGVTLCWATLNLLRLYGVAENKARWGAVLNMAFWMLHPYMVSTTLYVIQRMAQLAALFMLGGLVGYLHGRLIFQEKKRAGYVWMSLSLAFGTALAALSKENGILLPLLVSVVEWCRPKSGVSSQENAVLPDWRWRAIFLWIPSLVVILVLLRYVNFSPNVWPARPFNQVERLLTEPRILWEYMLHLYIPRIEGRGLFQDGFIISKNLMQPIETLWGFVGVIALFVAAITLSKRWPYFSLAIIFFLSSHLVESTVIGLELYFEHRNYIAAAFLFLPIVMGILWIAEKKSLFVAVGASFSVICMLALLTFQRATLWSDTNKLQAYWAIATPDSPRAQNYLAVQLFKNGKVHEGFKFLESASERLPQSSLLTMQWLLQKISRGDATATDFEYVKQRIPLQRFDAQAVLGLRLIVETLIESHARRDYQYQTLSLLDLMKGLPEYTRVPLFNRLQPYLSGLLLASLGEPKEAVVELTKAIQRYKDIDASLSMVAHMGNVGRPNEALQLLDEAKKIYSTQPDGRMKRPRSGYDMEIQRLEKSLKDDLRAGQIERYKGNSQ